MISTLKVVITKMACAGKSLTWSNLFAPRYCDKMEEIALRVCPKTQISIDKNVATIPTAAKDSVGFTSILPTIAASVKDKIGSDTPEINAGMAKRLMCFNEIEVLTGLMRLYA